jgi:hypothetical protein
LVVRAGYDFEARSFGGVALEYSGGSRRLVGGTPHQL